ncbi:GTP-binding protein [Simiduia litorea]|uniref:CobW family GTP-binding protein n=1 Tax=Simiduia litorea TaxID=1435348 RepID=UPI0036F373A3
MDTNVEPVLSVPTNIITGFLGVGKTTAILHLLKSKPESERWAVLVNEFGEIGVDGSLIQGQHAEGCGVFIREVPGGCMCCAAGLPMHIALNQLLSRAKPHRLLIEPTGLGHPKEVLEVLSADHYRGVLDIQKCVTLIDARKLHDSRYTNHDTFNQQIDIADVVVGNKQELYQQADKALLKDYIQRRSGASPRIYFASYGKIDAVILQGASASARVLPTQAHRPDHHHERLDINTAPIPACGYLQVENSGEGFRSLGWRFSPEKVFNRDALFTLLSGLRAERMKAVFITQEGVFGYNLTPDALTEFELDDCLESRIEIIASEDEPLSQLQLLQCLTD